MTDPGPALGFVGRKLAAYLTTQVENYQNYSIIGSETLKKVIQPGDVLLVEGDHRISLAIKYLTQSTWSHAALYAGTVDGNEHTLIEADLENGVIAVPLAKYDRHNIRICRPWNLQPEDNRKVCDYMVSSIGLQYDLKNITDLARYLLPQPPVPRRWRRRMLALGSGDPTRAVCSTLIAQAFQNVGYPILPQVLSTDEADCPDDLCYNEILHIRHHSLFAPRDFDVSPYFDIVKAELALGFDYRQIKWQKHSDDFIATGQIGTASE